MLGMFMLAAGLPATPADWRLSPKEVRDGVKSVVAEQLAAFQRDDIASAYALAAAGIRQTAIRRHRPQAGSYNGHGIT